MVAAVITTDKNTTHVPPIFVTVLFSAFELEMSADCQIGREATNYHTDSKGGRHKRPAKRVKVFYAWRNLFHITTQLWRLAQY